MNHTRRSTRGYNIGGHRGGLPRLAALMAAGGILSVPSLYIEASAPTEYQVKAAYLYNFGKFVQWPAKAPTAPGGLFAICVLGQDPFGPILDATVAGETIDGRSVVAKRISRAQDAADCRILFISSSEDDELGEILAALDKTSVLTVSDIPEFTRRGGIIHLVLDGNKVRFEVNLAVAERAGLSLSSQLLKLAINMRRSD